MGRSADYFNLHPLQDDPVLQLFYFLWKKNKHTLESCPHVTIPTTIVYENNFPRAWFSSSDGITRRTGKELDTKTIYRDLCRTGKHNHSDIVASFLSQSEDADGHPITSVEFFDSDDLAFFLFKRERKEHGILQRFIRSKGSHNSVIQAVWTPHVTVAERRDNIHKLHDSKFGIYERSVTYEGPSHYSKVVFCSPKLQEAVENVCRSIVDHFYAVEHRKINRMVLYFKIDPNNTLHLLWSSFITINTPQSSRSSRSTRSASLDLSPKFFLPERQETPSPTSAEGSSSSEFHCPVCSKHLPPSEPRHNIPVRRVLRQYLHASRRNGELSHLSFSMTTVPSRSHSPFAANTSPKSTASLPASRQPSRPGSPLFAHGSPSIRPSSRTSGSTAVSSTTPGGARTPGHGTGSAPRLDHVDESALSEIEERLYEAYSHFMISKKPYRFDLEHENSDALRYVLSSMEEEGVELQKNEAGGNYVIPAALGLAVIGRVQNAINRAREKYAQTSDESMAVKLSNTGNSSFQGFNSRLQRTQSEPVWGSNDRERQVPSLIYDVVPEAIHMPIRKLIQDPVLLGRTVKLCEECFLKLTQQDKVFKTSNYHLHRKRQPLYQSFAERYGFASTT
eukprot:gb/GECH01014138.1/.p1 GENE.gb/GECH01014138.1/~~gb/GECH01014138.1/.p1  ORF type:complete len:620 (+),score=82.48 gb/GECH01014138.1/:1-1860(+)